ncbi:MAG: ATP-dependent helicase HepA [Verrucomicrobiales bacterium]|nr:ATP-dependent helicase HepA [Verrucomicrobiales bacterium]
MVVNRFVAGQRWLSQTEPELGLGLVLKVEPDRVNIVFPSSETTRVYTVENPPLTRVSFSVGDVLKTQEGKEFTVEDLIEKDGLVTYINKGKKVEESRLSDSLTFSKPFDRLLNAQVDDKPVYNLRHRALYRRFKTLRAPLRGFFNGRFNPRQHQLYVAVQATRQAHPRVLLADECGMGKTVEAGLILQRLKTFGSANRVLLLAPEAMLETLELELSRRFSMTFARVSADDFATAAPKAAKKSSTKKGEESTNPFYGEEWPWESCSLEDLSGGRGKRAAAAAEAGWDVVVVAGGETLEWTEEGGNASWVAVETVSTATKSLIILSDAGPELDAKSHFGRLHLLDPEGFATPRKYAAHRKTNEAIEAAITQLLGVTAWDRESDGFVKPLAASEPKLKEALKLWKEGREEARDQILDYLLDGQEQGRYVFRNTRQSALGIPTREISIVQVECLKPEVREGLKEEFKLHGKPVEAKGKAKAQPSAADSVLALWLASLVNPAPPAPPTVPAVPADEVQPPAPLPTALVICSSRGRALAVEKVLSKKVQGLVELVGPDIRGSDDIAPSVVVVGEEDMVGRSFPGMDITVLWDTPLSLQEASGRVFTAENSKRRDSLKVLIPVIEDTPQEMTAQWLEQGLHAFSTWSPAQAETALEFAKPVHDIAKRIGVKHNPKLDEELKALIKKSASTHDSALKRIDKHRDYFLESVSCRKNGAEQAAARMKSTDDDDSLDIFMNRTLEQLGILVETKSGRTVVVKPNPEASFRLEEIPKEGMKLCYSRTTAMVREDADFLTWDHPLVFRATDRLLATAIGNTAYVVWEDERAQIVLLEGIFLATPASSDPALQASRHMPPTPVRVVISHDFEDMSGEYTSEMVNKIVRNGRREWLRNNARPLYNIIPSMMRSLTQRASIKMRELAGKASHQMEAMFTSDIARLRRLPATTRREEEIARLEALIATLKPLLTEPVLSLDQLRLLRRGPSGKGI